uniref:hypothetical protein n=1 Tax=Klebsiella pneumoniae TaxID=573 RepID=UPI0013D75117
VAGFHQVRLLPPTYNFPCHALNDHPGAIPRPLVHLHYHWLFAEPSAPGHAADPRLGHSDEVAEWLKARLPLPA